MTDLTIIMPCWNKEAYIAEALDSVFAQRTAFSYEVVVADDHSTDRTVAIAEAYGQRHPGVMTVLRSDENQKLFRNVRRAYAVCKTPFFCVLDPDDYWTDAHHIDKALTFLTSHPNFTIYSAGIEMLHPDGHRERVPFPDEARDSTWKDYLKQRATIAFTQTCVYRNVVFARGLPEKLTHPSSATMEKSYRGDSFRNFLHIREGRAHFTPAVEGCYRVTDTGVYQGLSEVNQLVLNAQLFADLWRYDDGKHASLLKFSRELFHQASRQLPETLSAFSGDVAKLRSLGRDLLSLRQVYEENEHDLQG